MSTSKGLQAILNAFVSAKGRAVALVDPDDGAYFAKGLDVASLTHATLQGPKSYGTILSRPKRLCWFHYFPSGELLIAELRIRAWRGEPFHPSALQAVEQLIADVSSHLPPVPPALSQVLGAPAVLARNTLAFKRTR